MDAGVLVETGDDVSHSSSAVFSFDGCRAIAGAEEGVWDNCDGCRDNPVVGVVPDPGNMSLNLIRQ